MDEARAALLEALEAGPDATSRSSHVGITDGKLIVEDLHICDVPDGAEDTLLHWAVAHAVFSKHAAPRTASLLYFIQKTAFGVTEGRMSRNAQTRPRFMGFEI